MRQREGLQRKARSPDSYRGEDLKRKARPLKQSRLLKKKDVAKKRTRQKNKRRRRHASGGAPFSNKLQKGKPTNDKSSATLFLAIKH